MKTKYEPLKVKQTTSKWWVLSISSIGNAGVLAVCKTKKEAEKLRNQNKKFKGALLSHVSEYMHMF